jgi:hypothetical protein
MRFQGSAGALKTAKCQTKPFSAPNPNKSSHFRAEKRTHSHFWDNLAKEAVTPRNAKIVSS